MTLSPEVRAGRDPSPETECSALRATMRNLPAVAVIQRFTLRHVCPRGSGRFKTESGRGTTRILRPPLVSPPPHTA
jgi:hypothetical protein